MTLTHYRRSPQTGCHMGRSTRHCGECERRQRLSPNVGLCERMISKRPNEASEEYFQRAQVELITNLQARVDQVKGYTFADFNKPK